MARVKLVLGGTVADPIPLYINIISAMIELHANHFLHHVTGDNFSAPASGHSRSSKNAAGLLAGVRLGKICI